MAEMLAWEWWAWQGLNLRPLRCQHRSYRAKAQKSVSSSSLNARTRREQTAILRQVYRNFTAAIFAHLRAA